MSDPTQNLDLAARAVQTGQAVARLATDDVIFRAAVDAFRAGDTDSFLRLLTRVKATQYCEEICRWFASKECVLECLELCGIPKLDLTLEQIVAGTAEIARVSANQEAMERLADIVERRDTQSFADFVKQQKLQEYCRLVCHWACSIHFGLICEILCGPAIQVSERDLADQLVLSGKAIAQLAKDPVQLRSVIDAAIKLNCEYLQDVAARFEQCYLLCRWICSWRSIYVCSPACRILEIPRDIIDEERQFAQLSGRLADGASNYQRLFSSIELSDLKAYQSLVEELQIGPFCFQLCHWVSYEVCNRFCICVCPPPELIPQFTQIGNLVYATQIDSVLPATGLTNGATQAFYGNLRLNGVLTQTLGGQPLEYDFEYMPLNVASTTLAVAIGAGDTTIKVASAAGFPAAGPFNVVIGTQAAGYEIMTVTAVAGTTWTVTRGAKGTTAAPAIVGATIVTGTAGTGTWTQVPTTMIASTQIGTLEIPIAVFPFVSFVPVYAGDANAPFTLDGWIQVPQGSNFSMNDNLIILDSTQLAAFALVDETGVAAGAAAKTTTDLYFGLRMRVRQKGSATSSDGGTCSVVAIDNSYYKNVNYHPEWNPHVGNHELAVCMVDIAELKGAGCAGLKQSLTILFTASHPNLATVDIVLTGPGAPFDFAPLPPITQTGNWFNTIIASPALIATPCAYVVTITVTVLLTDGDGDSPGPITDYIAFCVK